MAAWRDKLGCTASGCATAGVAGDNNGGFEIAVPDPPASMWKCFMVRGAAPHHETQRQDAKTSAPAGVQINVAVGAGRKTRVRRGQQRAVRGGLQMRGRHRGFQKWMGGVQTLSGRRVRRVTSL
jgi:hypothetical protein